LWLCVRRLGFWFKDLVLLPSSLFPLPSSIVHPPSLRLRLLMLSYSRIRMLRLFFRKLVAYGFGLYLCLA